MGCKQGSIDIISSCDSNSNCYSFTPTARLTLPLDSDSLVAMVGRYTPVWPEMTRRQVLVNMSTTTIEITGVPGLVCCGVPAIESPFFGGGGAGVRAGGSIGPAPPPPYTEDPTSLALPASLPLSEAAAMGSAAFRRHTGLRIVKRGPLLIFCAWNECKWQQRSAQ